jgi:hypothetical protein
MSTSDPIPKLPSGSQTVVAKGTSSDNTFSRSMTIKPVVIRDPTSTISEPLTTNVAAVGDPVVLRSSVTIGVFGLKANTTHDIVVGGIKVTSFISTSDGAIPGAVSFTVPNLKSGLYYVDIVDKTTGKSALLGLTRYYSPPRSGYYSYTGETYKAYEPGLNSYTNAGPGLLLKVRVSITVTPTATTVGAEATLTGSGLTPNTKYYITISDNPTSLSGPYLGYVLGEFTSTAVGTIPAGVKVTIPDLPNPIEAGTTWYLHVSTSSQLGDLTSAGCGPVIIYASVTLSPTRGRAGDTVTVIMRGLEAKTMYRIHFGFVDAGSPGDFVGVGITNSLGWASATFTVPSKAEGAYRINLFDSVDSEYVLRDLPVFTIGFDWLIGPVTVISGQSGANEWLDFPESGVDVYVNGSAEVYVATYQSNPGTGFTGDIGNYIDVYVPDISGLNQLEIRKHYTDDEIEALGLVESSLRMYWWTGSLWIPCSETGVNTDENYIWARITATTRPSLSDISGTPFGAAGSPPPPPRPAVGGKLIPVDTSTTLSYMLTTFSTYLTILLIVISTVLLIKRRH